MKDKPEIAAITVIVVGIGLIAGLIVNEQRKEPSKVLGTQFRSPTPQIQQTDFGIPTLPVEIPTLPTVAPSATTAPTPSATATARATSSPRPASGTTTRASGVALYNIEIVCANSGTTADGKQWANSAKKEAERLVAGYRFNYTFSFDSSKDQRVSRSCSFKTVRVSPGSESPLRILLRCSGESTYSSAPPSPQTSAVSKSWRPAQLTGGYTHRMDAPRQSQQSERTSCAFEVVRV